MNVIFMIVAYITNPIVVLFADEYGNLPRILRWWQTDDNCLDVGWMITEDKVPDIFKYDFNKHYIYHLEDKSNNCIPGYVELIDPHFTMIERMKRYLCRLAWLYRNCAYGFAYEVCGRYYDPEKNTVINYYDRSEDDCLWISYIDDNKSWWNKTWSLYLTKPWCKWFYVRIYAGWKLKNNIMGEPDIAMLAFHFTFTRLRKNAR